MKSTNHTNIQAILDNVKQISMSPSSMEILCEFERVIDENGLYAFHHWKQGELVDGPNVKAYRVSCTFSWPLEKMPDPAGAARLLPYGVKVTYRKAWLVYPIRVKSENDFRPEIKKPKLARIKVWLVNIDMPKYLMKEITQSSKEIMDQELDMNDIGQGYEDSLDNPESTENNLDPGISSPTGF